LNKYLFCSAPLVALVVYGGLYALWSLGYQQIYIDIINAWGVSAYSFPFLDTDAILAARECWAKGIDVFTFDPCDVLGRPHVYSPVWLLGSQFLHTADLQPTGLCLDGLFLLSLWLLPQPTSRGAFLVTLGATLSTMVLYAVERANNDLVIFLIVLLAGRLSITRGASRFLGYAGFFFAGALKFYPMILIWTALREAPRVALALVASFGAGIVALFAIYHHSLVIVFGIIPHGSPFSDLFGASNLPNGVKILFTGPSGTQPVLLADLVTVMILCLWAMTVGRTVIQIDLAVDTRELTEPSRQWLTIGLLLLIGCFFSAQNIGYRGVLFLLIIPGLLSMARATPDAQRQLLYRRTIAVILFLMWEAMVRLLFAHFADNAPSTIANRLIGLYWVGRELVWWWLMGVLTGLLLRLLAEMPRRRASLLIVNDRGG